MSPTSFNISSSSIASVCFPTDPTRSCKRFLFLLLSSAAVQNAAIASKNRIPHLDGLIESFLGILLINDSVFPLVNPSCCQANKTSEKNDSRPVRRSLQGGPRQDQHPERRANGVPLRLWVAMDRNGFMLIHPTLRRNRSFRLASTW